MWFRMHDSRTMETWIYRPVELQLYLFMIPCFCGSMNPELWKHGTTELWSHEFIFAWIHVSVVPWIQEHGTTELWNLESIYSWIHVSTFLWFHESRTMELQKYGTMNPCFCGSMNPEPWNYRTTEPWIHVSVVLWIQNCRTMNPRFCGSLNPELQNHESRTMEKWNCRTMEVGNHGFMKWIVFSWIPAAETIFIELWKWYFEIRNKSCFHVYSDKT